MLQVKEQLHANSKYHTLKVLQNTKKSSKAIKMGVRKDRVGSVKIQKRLKWRTHFETKKTDIWDYIAETVVTSLTDSLNSRVECMRELYLDCDDS